MTETALDVRATHLVPGDTFVMEHPESGSISFHTVQDITVFGTFDRETAGVVTDNGDFDFGYAEFVSVVNR